MSRKYKKLFSILTILAVLLALITPLYPQIVKASMEIMKTSILADEPADSSMLVVPESKPEPKEEKFEVNKSEAELNFLLSNPDDEAIQQEQKYTLTIEKMEELYNEGYSFEDMSRANYLGNIYDQDPIEIMNMKHQSKDSWENFEKKYKEEKLSPLYGKLKEKHKKQADLVEAEGLEFQERFRILLLFDKNNSLPVEELTKHLKMKNNEAFEQVIQNTAAAQQVSEEILKKHQLTKDLVDGLNYEEFSRIEQNAEKKNLSLKQILESRQKEKQKPIQQHIEEKEADTP